MQDAADALFIQQQLDQGKSEQEAAQLLIASKQPGGRDLASTFNWATNAVKPVTHEIPVAADVSANLASPADLDALKATLAGPQTTPEQVAMAAQDTSGEVDGGGAMAAPPPSSASTSSPGAIGGQGITTLTDTQTSTGYRTFDPKLMDKVNKAQDAELDASKKVYELQAAQAEVARDEQIAYSQELKRTQEAEAARQKLEQQEIDARQASLDGMVDEYNGMQIDNQRFWGNLDTGNRILAGVSIAIGALGQALSYGKSNAALDMIDKSIDRDIDEQKANMDKKGRQVQQARGIYQEFRAKVGDDRTARSLAREAAWKAVKSDFDIKAQTLKSDEAKALAAQGGAAAQLKVDAERMSRTERTISEVKKTSQAVAKPGEVRSLEAIIGADAAKNMESAHIAAAASQELVDLVNSPEWGDVGKVSGSIDAIGRKLGLSFEEGADVQTRLDLIGKEFLRSFSGMGVTDKELERFMNTLPNYFRDPEVGRKQAATFATKYQGYYEAQRDRIITPYVEKGYLDRDIAAARYPSFKQNKKNKYGATK